MALVVFLRGVNVGGHRVFRPTAVAAALRHLGIVNIGAAGTFVIQAPVSRAQLRAHLKRVLPFETTLTICAGRDVAKVMSLDVVAGRPPRPGVVTFVSVLTGPPRLAPRLPVRAPSRGPWLLRILARHGRFVIGQYRRDMRVIGYFTMLDRLFGVPVTSRNWNTMTAVAKALSDGRRGRAGA